MDKLDWTPHQIVTITELESVKKNIRLKATYPHYVVLSDIQDVAEV